VTVNLSSSELRLACTALFGAPDLPGHDGDEWPRALRSAFRRRVFETHPDRAQALGRSEEELRHEFTVVNEAYQLLSSLPVVSAAPAFQAAPQPAQRPVTKPTFVRTARPFPQRPQRPQPARPHCAHARAPAPGKADRFYQGPLPSRPLLLGEYLYYSGRISWESLIDALLWQRRGHQPIGRLAVQWGYLTAAELQQRLRQHRWQHHSRGAQQERFGEFLLRRGEITSFQLLALLGRQKRLRRRIGEFFLERGLCEAGELEAAVRWQSARKGGADEG
jgi:hypothetical protein